MKERVEHEKSQLQLVHNVSSNTVKINGGVSRLNDLKDEERRPLPWLEVVVAGKYQRAISTRQMGSKTHPLEIIQRGEVRVKLTDDVF
jgi:hypothetical protein